jgi:hypothetical protein
MTLQKNQWNGKFYFSKSGFAVLYSGSFEKTKIQEILKFSKISKTQNFQNSIKIWIFTLEIYVQRKFCYKLHKESPKNLAGIENPWFQSLASWQILTHLFSCKFSHLNCTFHAVKSYKFFMSIRWNKTTK